MSVQDKESFFEQLFVNPSFQSALEEREREIRKMLMERELEKTEQLKGFESNGKVISKALFSLAT